MMLNTTSFSPLEIAKARNPNLVFDWHKVTIFVQAFDAPLLEDVPCTYTGYKILGLEGSRNVQYGIFEHDSEIVNKDGHRKAEKLVIADKARVREPVSKRPTLGEYHTMLSAKAAQCIPRIKFHRSATKGPVTSADGRV